jgi:hypothetical protein
VLQESSIDTLLHKGADQNKLVLGLPLFGIWLKNTEGGVGFQKVIEGAGLPGSYGQWSGFWEYKNVSFCSCDVISRRDRASISVR